MKTKSILKSGMEVLDSAQLSKIKGGRTVVIYIDGRRYEFEVPG